MLIVIREGDVITFAAKFELKFWYFLRNQGGVAIMIFLDWGVHTPGRLVRPPSEGKFSAQNCSTERGWLTV
jgi:hypothetical protein